MTDHRKKVKALGETLGKNIFHVTEAATDVVEFAQQLLDENERLRTDTGPYFQNPRDRIAILSLFRAQCLWDDLGDAGIDPTATGTGAPGRQSVYFVQGEDGIREE